MYICTYIRMIGCIVGFTLSTILFMLNRLPRGSSSWRPQNFICKVRTPCNDANQAFATNSSGWGQILSAVWVCTMQRLQTFTVHGIGWVGFTSTCQLMHSCISRHQNTRPLAKANDPAGLYGHALSLVAKSDFSGAKEFLDKAGFCKFQCWTGKRTELKWSNGRLVTRIKLRLFALPLNGFGSLLLGLASRTSHSIASSICQALYNPVVEHDRCNHGTAWHLKINALHISSFESYSRSKSFAFAPSSLLGVIFICCSALAQSSRVRTLQVGGFWV